MSVVQEFLPKLLSQAKPSIRHSHLSDHSFARIFVEGQTENGKTHESESGINEGTNVASAANN